MASAGFASGQPWALSGGPAVTALGIAVPPDAPTVLWAADPSRVRELLGPTHEPTRVLGAASVIIQFATALGPSFYGLLHELSGGYRMPLLLAAALDIIACAVILTGSRPRRDTAT